MDIAENVINTQLVPKDRFPAWGGSYEMYTEFYSRAVNNDFDSFDEMDACYSALRLTMMNSCAIGTLILNWIAEHIDPLYDFVIESLEPSSYVLGDMSLAEG